MKLSPIFAAVLLAAGGFPALAKNKPAEPHNVLIFVADGLRADSVTPQTAPTLARIQREGINFSNPHSLFPTITTVNASAIATGHYIGDTGDFGNQLYTGFPLPEAGGATTPFLESDQILGEMNAHFGGNYLDEESLLAAARKAGFQTAAFGKVGPTSIQDVTARDGNSTIVIDDAVGTPAGLAVAPRIAEAIKAAGLPPTAPKTAAPNNAQERYLIDVATRVVLPKFKSAGKPFVVVFWSRDPDASQHVEKDSLGKLTPGINGQTGKAGVADADRTLAGLLAGLKSLALDKTTDVFVTADHGFSTIYKKSKTSTAAKYAANNLSNSSEATANGNGAPPAPMAGSVPDQHDLPPGFVSIDIADALQLPLFDPNAQKEVKYRLGEHPSYGNGLIGTDVDNPDIVVAANGGSDEIYLLGDNAADVARQIVGILAKEDYVSGIFVNDTLAPIPGALPMSAVNLRGAALTPQPSIVVNFRSFAVPGCKPLLLCVAEVADTSLDTGQGMHGSFSRADTKNFMAAIGPDFKTHFSDPVPVSNADITPTLAHVLGLSIPRKGRLVGRVIAEAFPRGKRISISHGWASSPLGENGVRTVLDYQQVGGTRYFDAAGFAGQTVGLTAH